MIKIFKFLDTNFNTNGECIVQPKKCIETKKKSLNGWYINVEVDIKYKEYIIKDNICLVKTKSKLKPQIFVISDKIEYNSRSIVFEAEHILFHARDLFLLDVRPTELTALNALNYINQRTDKNSPFVFSSNIETISTAYLIRKSLLEAMTTVEERWNGVYDADNYNIAFKDTVGNDNGEVISYAKNLENMRVYEDWSNVCTRIYPVGKEGLMLPEKYLDSDIEYDKPYTRTVDFETKLSTEEQTEENLLNELRANAEAYLEENKYPKVSYEVTSNINNKLEIGDIVHVKHPLVELKTEVLEYEYDLIKERTINIVFGNYIRDVKSKIDVIKASIKANEKNINTQGELIQEQTNIINSLNKNGHVYIDDNEVLVLDSLPKETARYVLRIGLGGIGFSDNGYEGPFETAWTLDGKFNADFISTGTLSAERIEGYNQLLLTVNNILTDETLQKIAEGYPVEIDYAGNYNIISNVINGKNEQETSTQGKNICPTDFSEWESGQYDGSGNKASYPSRIRTERLIPVLPNTTYYFNTNLNPYTFVVRTYDNTKTFVSSLGAVENNGARTTASNVYYLGISIWNGSDDNVETYSSYQTLFSNGSLKPFICLGSESDKTYEPFTPNKPSPDYPSEIETLKGVTNLFKPTLQVNGTDIVHANNTVQLIDDTFRLTASGSDMYFGQILAAGSTYNNARGYLIDISNFEKISYYITNPLFTKNFITAYNENKVSLGYTSASARQGTYTIPSGAKYISFRFGYENSIAGETYETKVMIKEGSTIPNYVPYGTWLEEKTIGKNFVTLTQNGSGNGLTYDIENNEVLLNGTTGGNGNILNNKNKYFTLKAGTYTFSTRILSGTYTKNDKDLALYLRKVSDNSLIARDISGWNNYTVNSLVFTLLEDTDIYIQIFTNGSGYIVNNLKIGYQIEKGSISTPIYEPYKENTALIDMNKENLFDDELEMGGYAIDGNSYNSNTRVRIKLPKTLEAGTYTYICSNTTKFILNKVGGGSEQVIDSNVGTFTLNQTQDCLFTIQSTDLLNVVVKLFKSNNPTPYYEVLEQDTLTVKDNIATLDKQWGKVVLTGNESWGRVGNVNCWFSNDNILNDMKLPSNNSTLPQMFCSHFKVSNYSNVWNANGTDNSIGVNSDRTSNPRIHTNSITTYAEWVAYLKAQYEAGTPVTIYYKLATPETIELPCEVLKLHKGYNYIDLNDDTTNMEVTYLTDSKFNATYATHSELDIKANSITSQLQSEIKELNTTINNTIEQKISDSESSTMSTISATYITKNDSAANISTAKSEAISSANSSTDAKLQNYSNTTQMNNAISQAVSASESSINLSVDAKISNISVGGENLLRDTQNFGNANVTANTMGYLQNSSATLETTTYQNLKVRTLASSNSGASMAQYYINNCKNGEQYTVSFYAKGEGKLRAYFHGPSGYITCKLSNGTFTGNDGRFDIDLTSEWKRYSITWTLADTGGTTDVKYLLFRNDNLPTTWSMCGLKFEKGNKATDYSPSQYDYSTTTDVNASLALKVGITEYGRIVSMLNASADTITLAGGSSINLSTAGKLIITAGNFQLDANGTATMTNANVSGTVTTSNLTADGGTIGGWTIGQHDMHTLNSSGNEVILADGTNANQDVLVLRNGNNYPFFLRADGYLHATNAHITGEITATSGTVGGFTIGSYSLYGTTTNGSMNIQRGSNACVDFPANGGRLMIGSTASNGVALTTASTIVISDTYSHTTTGDNNASIGIRAMNGHVRIASNYAIRLVTPTLYVGNYTGQTGQISVIGQSSSGQYEYYLAFYRGILVGTSRSSFSTSVFPWLM